MMCCIISTLAFSYSCELTNVWIPASVLCVMKSDFERLRLDISRYSSAEGSFGGSSRLCREPTARMMNNRARHCDSTAP